MFSSSLLTTSWVPRWRSCTATDFASVLENGGTSSLICFLNRSVEGQLDISAAVHVPVRRNIPGLSLTVLGLHFDWSLKVTMVDEGTYNASRMKRD